MEQAFTSPSAKPQFYTCRFGESRGPQAQTRFGSAIATTTSSKLLGYLFRLQSTRSLPETFVQWWMRKVREVPDMSSMG